jgi:nucleoid DNA-binding protein/cell division protein FtsN
MKIGMYISELLYDHDTVILPGFGEFFTKYKPARFLSEEGRIEAPSKTIAFNPEKTQGETPLIDHLCMRENMEAEQVSKYLEDFVVEIMQLLQSGKKVELEKVGIFSANQDGSLAFEPDLSINYLDEASAIGPVDEPPKKAAEVHTSAPIAPPAENQATPSGSKQQPALSGNAASKEVDITMEKEKKQKLPPALRWIAFTVVPLLLIIIILALNYQYFFGSTRKEKVTETTVISPGTETTGQVSDTAVTVRDSGTDRVESESDSQRQAVTDPTVKPPMPEPGRKVYYVVVGSFPDEETAEKLALDLRKQGASLASVFMKTGFDYYRVCYGYYYDLIEAEEVLSSVKSISPEAYVLHR